MNKFRFLFSALLFLSISASTYGQGQEGSVQGDSKATNTVMYSETAGLLTSTMLRVDYADVSNETCGEACGGGTEASYSCSSLSLWNNGERSFADPVPAGEILNSLEVTFQVACGAGNYDVYINNELISSAVSPGDPCSCGCGVASTTMSAVFEDGIPGYVYGGNNTIRFDFGGGNFVCVYYADILFDSSAAVAAVPTMSQWGIIALLLLFLIIGIVTIKNYSAKPKFAKVVE